MNMQKHLRKSESGQAASSMVIILLVMVVAGAALSTLSLGSQSAVQAPAVGQRVMAMGQAVLPAHNQMMDVGRSVMLALVAVLVPMLIIFTTTLGLPGKPNGERHNDNS